MEVYHWRVKVHAYSTKSGYTDELDVAVRKYTGTTGASQYYRIYSNPNDSALRGCQRIGDVGSHLDDIVFRFRIDYLKHNGVGILRMGFFHCR